MTAPAPEPEVWPRLVQAHLYASPVGSGTRQLVLLERRGLRLRCLDPYYCRAFWLPARDVLAHAKDLPLHGLAARLRRNRRERALLNMPFSAPAVRTALTMLRGGNRPTTAEQRDDEVYDRDVDDETLADSTENGDDAMRSDDDTAAAGSEGAATEAAQGAAGAAADATSTAKPKKGAGTAKAKTKKAAAVADPTISGKPVPVRKTAAELAGKAKGRGNGKAKPAAAKRAARPAGEATRSGLTTGNKKGYGRMTDESVLTPATQENKFKGERAALFNMIKPGMTVGQFVKAAEKKSVPRGKAIQALRSFRNYSVVDYTTEQAAA